MTQSCNFVNVYVDLVINIASWQYADLRAHFPVAINRKNYNRYLQVLISGGSVAEWSARWTRNPVVPGSDYLDLFHGSPDFKFSATFVINQPVFPQASRDS